MRFAAAFAIPVAVLVAAACATAADPPQAATPAPAASAAPSTDTRPPGQRLYARHCLSCHQSDGGGVPNMQPPIVGGTWVKGDPKALALFVMTGGFGSADRKDGAVDNVMPEFRQLPDEDLASILTYIREKFGGGASPVSPSDIAAARTDL
ncbi:MAG TPA: cytochrome c [Steroidobacteraceae bacterium]|jgi:mono/diheme cytochrome c family protein|nr:cytochrome c [Steroidobacteraceae bacterium]